MASVIDSIIEFHDISKEFPGVMALSNVNFSIKRGEVHALIGENGAGKSTLMKIISGVHKSDSGKIIFDGKRLDVNCPKAAEEIGISIIYQELNLINRLSAAENIFLGRQPRKNGLVDWGRMNREAEKIFKRLKINLDVKEAVRHLSIAQKQMIEIAKAISFSSKLIIMDEPTSSLSITETETLFSIIADLKANGITVVFISHRLDEIFQICDTVSVLRDGQYIDSRPVAQTTKGDLIAMMIGRELTKQFPERTSRIGETLLKVENLSDGAKIKNISFDVKKGEVLGFAGLVGAGRTETFRMIFGIDRKKSGAISVHGKEVKINSPEDGIRHKLGFVTENRKEEGLFLTLSIRKNIVMVALKKILHNGLLNYMYEQKISEEYRRALRIVTPSIEQLTVNLSGGNQQKVVLAKWLFSDAEIVILDEPTRGIDVGAKFEIYEIINRLSAEGKAVIVISSDMEEIMGICDRILVMSEGKITLELDRNKFAQDLITQYALGGDAS